MAHAVDVHDELGIDFHWDVRKLWSADLPVVALDVVDLLWLLELPFWTNGDQPRTCATSPCSDAPATSRATTPESSHRLNDIDSNPARNWVVRQGRARGRFHPT